MMKLKCIFLISLWKNTNSAPPKKIQQTKSAGKVMMIIFFDNKGTIYQHAGPPKTTVNTEYYVIFQFWKFCDNTIRESVMNW